MENALRSALRLNKFIQTATEDQIVRFCLEECEKLTQSKIGFFHFVNPDQETIRLNTWSENTSKVCHVPGFNLHYPVSNAGVWIDCLHQRKPVIHNDYQNLPHKKGLPPGHVPMIRELVVPIFEQDNVVAIIGVGNKETDYNQIDIEQLQLLAENVWFAIQRKRDQTERDVLLKELEAINNELQSIVYVTSHDLRSPLVNLDGFSSELEMCCRQISKILEDKQVPAHISQQFNQLFEQDITDSVQFIKASTKKMWNLVDGLLRVSRIGTALIRIEKLNMNELLQEVLTTTDFQIKNLGARVELSDLPECMGDRRQINQVFTNLIDNALKYRAPDRPVHIRISGTQDGTACIYTVRDNGIGISPSQLTKVFELFYRIEPDGSIGGEGLGLTVVHRILNRNKGRIWAESRSGEGAVFFVTLPAGAN